MSTSPATRDAEPPARGYHHGNLRAALVEEGLRAIAEGDRGNLSLRDVARRTGVSPNAVYRHFADKEALCAAMAAHGFRTLAAAAEAADATIEPSDAEARLRAYGRTYVACARANPALFRLMFASLDACDASPELAEASALTFASLRASVARVAHRPPDDEVVRVGALYAWSLVHGLSHLALDGLIESDEGDLDAAIDAVLRFAAARPQRPS